MDPFFDKYMLEPVSEFFNKLVEFMPNLLSSLIIIIIGFVLANIFKYLFVRFLKIIHFDVGCERIGVNQVLQKGGIRDIPSQITGRIIYWIFVSIFIIIALNSLRVPSVEQLMTKFLLYLPNVFVAIIIVVLGYVIGNFLGRTTLIASVNAGIPISGPLSHVVKYGIFIMSMTMALEQLGIGRTTITVAFGIIFGGVVLSLAIAFGLGGKDIARDYLEKRMTVKKEEEEKPDDIQHM